MKKLYLVDVSSLFFRAFFAIRSLTSPSGLPVNAIYGFLSMISKLMKAENPEYLVFCYDRKEPSFRLELYSEYKANRSEMPEDLGKQIPYIKRMADLLGIPSFEVPGYEADDLIGTLTRLGRQNNMEVLIVSGDKDFGQLIENHVLLYDTMKETKYDTQGVIEKWGVHPEQFIDYLAIVGDSSDNIPGVSGVGPKGAIKLLEEFGSLDGVYKNLDKIKSESLKQKLIASKEQAYLSQKLVTIVTDVPMDTNMASYHIKPVQTEKLRDFLRELNFKNLEKSLLGDDSTAPSMMTSVPAAEVVGPEISPVHTSKALAPVSEDVVKAVDVSHLKKELSPNDNVWGFFDTRGIYVAKENQIWAITSEAKEIGAHLEVLSLQWSGFDLKGFWHQIGAKKPKPFWDSMLAAYVVRAGDSTDFKKIYNKFTQRDLAEVASPCQIYQAHLELQKILKEQLDLKKGDEIYQNYELPLIPVLFEMEVRGIKVDIPLLKKQSEELKNEIASIEKEIHQMAGENFNVASPKQLAVILFEKMKLPSGKKTKTGYSTDNEVLEKIPHPLAQEVLKFRELAKLKSTYVDALQTSADSKGRVHTCFNQALAATGRLSSTQPNLQNIPIRTARGREVRQAFIAEAGRQLLSVDYSQIELRILAHISQDPNMTKAFIDDLDIHTATASEIYNVPLASVTADLRRAAKAVNFGIAYGQGVFGLAENLGISRAEAQSIIKRYFEKFKNVESYISETVKSAYEKGYVETLFGRRRYIDELQSQNAMLKKFGERAAINAPIQGTASDLVKKAMLQVAEQIPLQMLLQVHDELIFEGTVEELEKNRAPLVHIMENVTKLSVPLKVNVAIGPNWDEAH